MSHLHPHRADADQVFQKYLDRAISQINVLGDDIEACGLCEHDADSARVVGTGHPLADVMMIKYAPQPSELDEGVAFFGRAGEAILKGTARLNVDPLDLYGTNCIKCSTTPTPCMHERCPTWLSREISIVEPKLLMVMGYDALGVVNGLDQVDTDTLVAEPGRMQRWNHTCQAIWCPDIDESLDRPASKQAFWRAFRALGEWYADKPPW